LDLRNFAAEIGGNLLLGADVFQRSLYFTRRVLWLAVLLLPVAAGGCAFWDWNKADWNLENYRDPRAVDIDHRLEKPAPVVKNPF
jgi:hypothetical protein